MTWHSLFTNRKWCNETGFLYTNINLLLNYERDRVMCVKCQVTIIILCKMTEYIKGGGGDYVTLAVLFVALRLSCECRLRSGCVHTFTVSNNNVLRCVVKMCCSSASSHRRVRVESNGTTNWAVSWAGRRPSAGDHLSAGCLPPSRGHKFIN